MLSSSLLPTPSSFGPDANAPNPTNILKQMLGLDHQSGSTYAPHFTTSSASSPGPSLRASSVQHYPYSSSSSPSSTSVSGSGSRSVFDIPTKRSTHRQTNHFVENQNTKVKPCPQPSSRSSGGELHHPQSSSLTSFSPMLSGPSIVSSPATGSGSRSVFDASTKSSTRRHVAPVTLDGEFELNSRDDSPQRNSILGSGCKSQSQNKRHAHKASTTQREDANLSAYHSFLPLPPPPPPSPSTLHTPHTKNAILVSSSYAHSSQFRGTTILRNETEAPTDDCGSSNPPLASSLRTPQMKKAGRNGNRKVKEVGSYPEAHEKVSSLSSRTPRIKVNCDRRHTHNADLVPAKPNQTSNIFKQSRNETASSSFISPPRSPATMTATATSSSSKTKTNANPNPEPVPILLVDRGYIPSSERNRDPAHAIDENKMSEVILGLLPKKNKRKKKMEWKKVDSNGTGTKRDPGLVLVEEDDDDDDDEEFEEDEKNQDNREDEDEKEYIQDSGESNLKQGGGNEDKIEKREFITALLNQFHTNPEFVDKLWKAYRAS